MSYALDFLKLSKSSSPLEEARRLSQQDRERRKRSVRADSFRKALVKDLLSLYKSLEMKPFEKGFSYGCTITSKDPNCPFPDIDIGITRASLSISYSADIKIWKAIEKQAEVFLRHGYIVYDPQTGNITSLRQLRLSKSRFCSFRDSVIKDLQRQGHTVLGAPKESPWWKFW